MGLCQPTLIFFFPMSNKFFSNRDNTDFKIPFDVSWVSKPYKKQFMGQVSELPSILTCRGELGITGCILKEPGCFFDKQRNVGRLTPTEAGVHVSLTFKQAVFNNF